MSTQQQRQEWRELAERLSYFGLEGRAQSAITALLADVDALTQERDALAAELERVRAQVDAVPVDDIRKVTKAADMDGYSNWRVDEWLDELPQTHLAHTPTPGTR